MPEHPKRDTCDRQEYRDHLRFDQRWEASRLQPARWGGSHSSNQLHRYVRAKLEPESDRWSYLFAHCAGLLRHAIPLHQKAFLLRLPTARTIQLPASSATVWCRLLPRIFAFRIHLLPRTLNTSPKQIWTLAPAIPWFFHSKNGRWPRL